MASSNNGPRDTGALAAALAREGWAVFPCGPDKAPLTSRGFHDASSDPDTVAAWTWPDDALIGAALPDNVAVLDVDPRNGGDDTMAVVREHHTLPRTRVVKTAGGGTHYYYRVPDGLELRGRFGNGVDVKRAGRGYVIVPPSPGYRLFKSDPISAMPEWMLETLVATNGDARAGGEAHEPKYHPVLEDGTAYGLGALRREIATLREESAGGRNDALNRATFALAQLSAGGELNDEHAIALLEETAAEIGLEARETRRTIESGWEAGLAVPRQAPEREDADIKGLSPSDGLSGSPVGTSAHFWLDWDVEEAPPAYILEPVIPENAYILVYGPTEASKSMVFMALGVEAAIRGVRTTLYSLENPPHVDRDRLRRLGAERGNFRASNEPLDLNDPAQFTALVERERDFGTRLVIIDTYSHAFNTRSEDGNARAIEFARRIRYLMHETSASVVVIDHTGYVHDEPRDASAKRQQVDVCILMSGSDAPWQPGQDATFHMKNRKAARFGNPFNYTGRVRGRRNEPLELVWDSTPGPTWAVG